MFELNGEEYSNQDLQDAAIKYDMDFDSYLETMKKKGLVEKLTDSATADPITESSTDSGSDDGSSVLLDMREAEDYELSEAPEEEEEEEEETSSIYNLIKDISSRQDNNIAAINEQTILRVQDEENKQKLFEQFKEEHGTEDPVEAFTNQQDKNVFMEKVSTGTLIYDMPENKGGFLLNDFDFSNTNTLEEPRQHNINKKADEERVNFESKFALK